MASDLLRESTMELLQQQQQEILDRLIEWKADQNGLFNEWRGLLCRLEENLLQDPHVRPSPHAEKSFVDGYAKPAAPGSTAPREDVQEIVKNLGPMPQMQIAKEVNDLWTAAQGDFPEHPLGGGTQGNEETDVSPPCWRSKGSSPSVSSFQEAARKVHTPSICSLAGAQDGSRPHSSSSLAGLDELPGQPMTGDHPAQIVLGNTIKGEPTNMPTHDDHKTPETDTTEDLGGGHREAWDSPSEVDHPSAIIKSSFRMTKSTTKHLGMLRSSKTKQAEQCIIASKRNELESRQGRLRRLTRGKAFEAAIMILIIMNTMVIGWQTQVLAVRIEDSFYSGSVHDDSNPAIFAGLQVFFTVVFLIDVGLRWVAEGAVEFVSNHEWAWNCFDILTVVIGCLDLLMEYAKVESFLSSVSVVRVLRILRLVRVVRMIRTYSFFRELRMMVESCLCGLKSYMWCCLVIGILLYVFGITMTTSSYSYIASTGQYAAEELAIDLQMSFGTLDKSMLSLFQAITGGRDWGEFYVMIGVLGAWDRIMFWIFLSFSLFAVTNAVAAVFVESAMQSSQHDRELLIKEQLTDAVNYQQQMMNVFEEMDADGTGTITLDEFIEHLDDDRVRAYFQTLKLDVSDAASLFKLLDQDKSGSVEIQEFIEGCHSLKGEARSLDLRFLRFEVDAVRRDVDALRVHLLPRDKKPMQEEHLPQQTLSPYSMA